VRLAKAGKLSLQPEASACLPRSTTLSTFNAIWSRDQRCGSSEPRRRAHAARTRYAGYRFPAEVISHAVWLYFRFPLGLRMVEELLAARGIIDSQKPSDNGAPR
jgi:hypothetical protein